MKKGKGSGAMAELKWKKKGRRTPRIEVRYDEEGEKAEIRPDIISTLPDNILTSILPLLSLKEAFRTTLLSKGWSNHFHNIPHIVIDHKDFDVDKWPEVLNAVLRYRGKEPIQSFKMTIQILKSLDGDLDEFLDALCKNISIKELVLHNMNDGHFYRTHSSVFSSNSLVTLNLEQLRLTVPQSFDGLRSLKSLRLKWVMLTNEDFERLASRCGALEELFLHYCSTIDTVNLGFFPRLWSLELYSYRRLLTVTGAAQVKKVNFAFCMDHNEMYWNENEIYEVELNWIPWIVGLIVEVRNVEDLALRIDVNIAYELEDVPEGLGDGITMINVKKFVMTVDLSHPKVVSLLSCLLESCPQLHELVLLAEKLPVDGDELPWQYLQAQTPAECIVQSLTHVLLDQVNIDFDRYLGFARFLLQNGRRVKEMTVSYDMGSLDETQLEKLSLLQGLASSPNFRCKLQAHQVREVPPSAWITI